MINKIKGIIKEAVDDNKLPGATFGIITLDSEEYGNYGYSQIVPEKVENNIDTLYDMASCTKVVATTTMILKMIEDHVVELDDSVCKHLPEFKYSDVTIKHLLTHTSGLPADDKKYKLCKDKQELVDFIYKLDLNNKPGVLVEYSDFGYILLGLIIEKYKNNLEEYANEILFKPLGMNNTMYNPYLKNRKQDCACAELTETRGLIQGQVHDGKAYILNGLSGNAGLFSCVKDLGKFVKMMLNDGEPVLKKETVDMLKHSYTDDLNLPRTLGWMFNDKTASCGEDISDVNIFHTGFSGTSIYIDFVNKLGIVLLTNRVHPSRDNVAIIQSIRKQVHSTVLKKAS